MQSLASGTKLRFFSPVELEEIFLHAEVRTVNKYGVIPFESNTYEAPAELVGKSVVVRYNPFHLEYLHVYFKDKYFGTAKIIDLKTSRHRSVGSIPEESGYDSDISRMYLENIKSNYQKYLEGQLGRSIDKNCVGKNTPEPDDTDRYLHPVRPPKKIEVTITRDEFIDIVCGTAKYALRFIFHFFVGYSFSLAIIKRLTGSVWLCVLFHAALNAICSVFAVKFSLTGNIIISAVILIIVLFLSKCKFIQHYQLKTMDDFHSN